jgi:molecular chaperone Hsp33
MQPAKDSAIRAITDDGAFRVITVQTTETVRRAAELQGARGETARLFSDLLTGTVLVRETMAPDLRVQGILQSHNKQSRILADAHPEGATRGLVQIPEGSGPMALGDEAVMQMMRTLHNGQIHQGIVRASAEGGISGALMQYMQRSEQVLSVVAVGTHMDGDAIVAAGGYIVQLLPELSEGALMIMTERLKAFRSIDDLLASGASDPAELLDELLYGMPYTRVGEASVSFKCHCSETRLAASLATLPKEDIQSFLDDGQVLEIKCDYCAREYRIAPETLRGLVSSN